MNLSLTSDEDEAAEDPLRKLLRQVYTTHRDKINAVKDTLSGVQEQLQQLKHDNKVLESAVRSKTEENEQLEAENKDLEDQLRDIRQRPPPVCKECEGLRLKVKVLSGIRERIFQCLDLGGADAKGQGRFSRVDTNTLQSLYTQVMDSEMFLEHPDDEVPPSPEKPTRPNVTSRSKASTTSQNKTQKADQAGTKEGAVRNAEAEDVTSTMENAPAQVVEEVSPKQKRNLRLPKRANKRHRVTEEGQPNSKRTRTLQTTTENTVKKGTSFHGVIHSDTNKLKLEPDSNVSNSAPPRILAPDTCDMSMDNNNAACLQEDMGDKANKKPTERKITAKDRPNLIIPETVPMAFTDDEGEEENKVNSQSQPLSEQLTVRNLDLSPPSLASTPVCSNHGYPLNLGQSPSKYIQDEAMTVGSPKRRPLPHYPSTDSQSYDDDISSDAGSPVFKRNPVMRNEVRQQSVQSPSLFDEDEADIESISSTLPPPPTGVLSKAAMSRMALQNQSKNDSVQNKSNHDLSVSVQSNPSPSMLSGKILSKLKHGENSEWLSTSVSKNSPQAKKDQGKSPPKSSPLKSKLSVTSKTATHSNELSSPVRMTRSKKSSQEKGSLNSSKGSNSKSLKQTTIKKGFFQPKKTKLSSLEGFNGGRLAGSQQRQLSREEQELHDLNEAVKRSIDDLKTRQSQDDLGFTEMDVEMTEPQFTSTPFIPQNKGPPRRSSSDDSTSSDTTLFKKPSTPTTPKRRRSKDLDLELRRSPRLKDDNSQNDTIDPTATSPENKRTSKTSETQRKQTSAVNRSLDLSKHEVTNQSLLQANSEVVHANGSLDPDVRLSEWDADVSAMVTSHEEHYLEPVSLLDIYSAESENRTQTQQTVVTQGGAGTKPGGRQASDSEDEIEMSGGSVVFGSTKMRPGAKGHNQKEKGSMKKGRHTVPESLDDSFDRVPKKKEPEYAHAAVVRKQAERNKLQTYACNECDRYYADDKASEDEIKRRMANCRHKARYVPPGTPENFWTVGFPDTQECQERGYMNKTQHKPSNHRRKRPFKSLFNAEKETTTSTRKSPPVLSKVSPGRRPRVMGDVTALFEGDDSQGDDT